MELQAIWNGFINVLGQRNVIPMLTLCKLITVIADSMAIFRQLALPRVGKWDLMAVMIAAAVSGLFAMAQLLMSGGAGRELMVGLAMTIVLLSAVIASQIRTALPVGKRDKTSDPA
jgi:hypothetical protein